MNKRKSMGTAKVNIRSAIVFGLHKQLVKQFITKFKAFADHKSLFSPIKDSVNYTECLNHNLFNLLKTLDQIFQWEIILIRI